MFHDLGRRPFIDPVELVRVELEESFDDDPKGRAVQNDSGDLFGHGGREGPRRP
jgi:hypothetical protein